MQYVCSLLASSFGVFPPRDTIPILSSTPEATNHNGPLDGRGYTVTYSSGNAVFTSPMALGCEPQCSKPLQIVTFYGHNPKEQLISAPLSTWLYGFARGRRAAPGSERPRSISVLVRCRMHNSRKHYLLSKLLQPTMCLSFDLVSSSS